MEPVEFVKWPSISRENPFKVTITEKIDGTNACIIIQNNTIVGVQSRTRFIIPDNDNFGIVLLLQSLIPSYKDKSKDVT